jgi:hypothetical protein
MAEQGERGDDAPRSLEGSGVVLSALPEERCDADSRKAQPMRLSATTNFPFEKDLLAS